MTDFHEEARPGESRLEPRLRARDEECEEYRQEKRPRLSPGVDCSDPPGVLSSGDSGLPEIGMSSALACVSEPLQTGLAAVRVNEGNGYELQVLGPDAVAPPGGASPHPIKTEYESGANIPSSGLDNVASAAFAPGQFVSAGLLAPRMHSMTPVGALPSGQEGLMGAEVEESAKVLQQLRGAFPAARQGDEQGVGSPIERMAKLRRLKSVEAGQGLGGAMPPPGPPEGGDPAAERSDKLLESLQEFASFVQQACLPEHANQPTASQAAQLGPQAIASLVTTPQGALQFLPVQTEGSKATDAPSLGDSLALHGSSPALHSMAETVQKLFVSMAPGGAPKPGLFLPQPTMPMGISGPLPPMLMDPQQRTPGVGAHILQPNKAIQQCQAMTGPGLPTGAIPQEYYSIPAVQLPQGMRTPVLVDPSAMLTLLGQQQGPKVVIQPDAGREMVPGQKVAMEISTAGPLSVHSLTGQDPQARCQTVPGVMQFPLMMGQQVYAPGQQGMEPGALASVHPMLHMEMGHGSGLGSGLGGVPDIHSAALGGELGLPSSGVGMQMLQEVPVRPQEPLPKTTVRGLLHVFSDDMRFIFFSSQKALFGDSAWVPSEFHYTDLSETEKHGSPLAQRFFVELINRIKGSCC
ncbi:unnamed protein product [Ostreobium quekettii]|uniref:Uncharacterized protein n=1 Tax=Ostreobium quekettii TaxID=121088 RepID=A0A8S1J3I9_9CHLO|nr:unnamed protein product [Ostreobium quekettii]|eukprot:evm.model.scf_78.2 EVM.evm.TU.scf_78.2   scf_78:19096-21000(+)